MSANPLIVNPIHQACEIKWAKGQEHYGKEFVGDPVEQMYEEAIDGINYAKEGRENWGYDAATIMEIEGDFYILADKIRSLYTKGKRNKKATAKQFARPEM
jgi:hypothetical protein